MGSLDALWHLLNFVAPALGVAVLASSMAKLIWRRDLAAVPWPSLVLWAAGAGAIVLIAGLVVFGRDGKMVTYAALVAASALVLWWVGFMRR
jgi:hypothetical protein